jgi:predicted MFS family arabinose efflux permease
MRAIHPPNTEPDMTDQAPTPNSGAAARRRLPGSIASLESVPFRWLAGSMLTFFLSMQGGFLIRSLLAWDLTHSELSLAYINLVIALPMMVGSFVAGAVIDRMERRRIVIVGQALIMLAEGTVLALMFTGLLQFWHLLATSFCMGVIYPFIMPTRTAMVIGLVGRDRIGNAMALMTAAQNIARVIGPSLTGALIPFINLEGAFIVSLALYLVSTLSMLALSPSQPVPSGRSLVRDVAYSFTYIAQHRSMLLTVIFGILPLLLTLPVFSMLVVFTEDVWQTGEAGLGILMAMIGLGGITGSIIVARKGDDRRRGRWMVISAALFAVLLAGFCLSPSFALAAGLLLSGNIFANISVTQNNTIVQLLAHEEVRGRMSSLMMLSLGVTPLAVLPIAWASETFGVDHTMFVACLILLAVIGLLYACSPTLRHLDRQVIRRRAEEDAAFAARNAAAAAE